MNPPHNKGQKINFQNFVIYSFNRRLNIKQSSVRFCDAQSLLYGG